MWVIKPVLNLNSDTGASGVENGQTGKESTRSRSQADVGGPSPRFGSSMCIRQGVLYLFGGMYEDEEDRQLTFKDFYSLGKIHIMQ